MVPIRQTPLAPGERAARADALPRKVVSIGNLVANLGSIVGQGEARAAKMTFIRNVLAQAVARYLRIKEPQLGLSFIEKVRNEDPNSIRSTPLGSLESVDMTGTLDLYIRRNGFQSAVLAEIAGQKIPATFVAEAAESVAFTFSVDRFVGEASHPGAGGIMNEIRNRSEMQKQVLGPFWHDDVSDWLEKLAEEPA
jgi:hypothetical protein